MVKIREKNVIFSIEFSQKELNTFIFIFTLFCGLFLKNIVLAQIVPDNTLGSDNVAIQKNGNNISITGGVQAGKSLFQSFQKFNVDSNQNAIFIAPNQIKTIFSRVTGNEASSLLGNISSQGNQNIFFLNPNGIIFGTNSRININGSFFATTGSGFSFLDGSYFNSDGSNRFLNPEGFSLIFKNPGDITVNNIGHNTKETNLITPLLQNTNPGMGAKDNHSIGLIGGNIFFNGGILSSDSSSIFIGAIKSGSIEFNFDNEWVPNFTKSNSLGNIDLDRTSLISTTNRGSLYLLGSQINLSDNSGILHTTNNTNNPGIVSITANDSLNLTSTNSNGSFRSIISVEALGNSKSALITIDSKDINILDGSIIGSKAFQNSTGGKIIAKVSNKINISGSNPNLIFSNQFSALASVTLGTGDSGEVSVSAKSIDLLNGGNIGSTTFNLGNSGNVGIVADEVNVQGVAASSFAPSTINAASFGPGNGGTVTLTTGNLKVNFGGRVGTSALSSGNAGDLIVNAQNSISLTGLEKSPYITSLESAVLIDPVLQSLYPLPPIPSGIAGNVTVTAPNISLSNGAEIIAINQGLGNGGKLTINANNRISLKDSNILASTSSGNGGNTEINTNILIQQNSNISSSASRFGNGGNTTIVARGIAGDYKSAISANADQGFGGNIKIDTQALVYPLSNITATSAKGLAYNGSVNIKSVSFSPVEQAPTKPMILGRFSPEICNSSLNERKFLVTAADIPLNIDDIKETDSPIANAPYSLDNKTGKKILDVGMQGLIIRPDGKGEPVAYNNQAFGGSYLVNACKEFSKTHVFKN
jgi:filamentous hemagglutinin family protein